MMNQLSKVTAFAPATTSNLAVGFDLLGGAITGMGDEIILEKSHGPLTIVNINGATDIPYDISKNAATVALQAMLEHLKLRQGFNVTINKGIPLGSGLGGSAASSVGTLVALNHFLLEPLSLEQLVPFCFIRRRSSLWCSTR